MTGLDHSTPWSAEALIHLQPLVAGAVLKAKVVSNTNHFAVLDITLQDGRNLSQVMMEFGVKKFSEPVTASPRSVTTRPVGRQSGEYC